MNYLEKYLTEKKKLIDLTLDKILYPNNDNKLITEAMRYAVLNGGKRIRPILTLATAESCEFDPRKVMYTACAIELIHNYSLIHDDLPAMDNDDYRRGKLTLHRKYNEAVAILVGDALLTKAFELIAENTKIKDISYTNCVEVIKVISRAIGSEGMIDGQILDVLKNDTKNKKISKKFLNNIYIKKTSCLIEASVVSGAILSNVDVDKINKLSKFGKKIGLAFQIVDDLLDNDPDKFTYVSLYGRKESKIKAINLVNDAKTELDIFGDKANNLKLIADYIVKRNY
jgi:geranylgeranyl diphosphate synthase type II